jgi:nucleotide-binding universal stress UspA family protein
MYRHILIPTDGSRLSEASAEAAVALARALGARVTALHVLAELEEPRLEGWARGDRNFPAKLGQTLRKRAAMYLETVREAAMCAGVPCECALASGPSPSGEIVREARDRGCDLIVMASHGRGDAAGNASSETLKVVALAGMPVLAYHPVPAIVQPAVLTQKRRAS